mgnify:CR=1 FL=1
MEPQITKEVDDMGTGYFTVRWSALQKVDKFTILKSVPAMAGIFELYYQDPKKKLIRFYIARVWIGGLRSTLRMITDSTLHEHLDWIDTLENKTCFFRYSLCSSFKDLVDVFYFFAETLYPGKKKTYHSRRFMDIRVNEISPEKIVTI